MGNTLTSGSGDLSSSTMDSRRTNTNSKKRIHLNNGKENPQETSRMLLLLYLINRTWNVVVDHKRKRSQRQSDYDSGAPRSSDDGFETDLNITDIDSLSASQLSFCSCSYCHESQNNFGKTGRLSYCESDFSYSLGDINMKSPSTGKNGQTTDMMLDIWNGSGKDNQRPPVYNPEDYIQSLKKYGRRPNGAKSVYDTTENGTQLIDNNNTNNRSATLTLPGKNNSNNNNNNNNGDNNKNNKKQIIHELFDDEMTLRQFGSITDLLTKLRADLRASFPSFVQEFVACPLDGTSILLEVLRAVQLSQTLPPTGMSPMPNSLQRNSQSYQRRALLDEMACLQCLSVCCARSPEAGARLGTTPVGLLPLAAAATGQGIRSRILALQLLSVACDKSAIGNGTQRSVATGHSAVSEALSTLRLRCGEPVRFRLLSGMLNSGGGSGELQAVGLRFVNTFLESAETTQNRLYIQAELFQAGLEPSTMTKSIASSSAWLEKLRNEVKKWEEIRIDIGRLQIQARESEKLRNQLVISERRVQILQEEKSVLTSMERRLQERCAELQREVFRLQGSGSSVSPSSENLEKRPIALPRQVPPHDSEHEDEGISSSETGPSLSPEPPRAFPKQTQQMVQTIKIVTGESSTDRNDYETNTTIDDVIEELQNIVSDAEREISIENETSESFIPIHSNEHEIVPVNLLPQPPRKSRSLVHLLSNPSDADGSDYGLLLIHDGSKMSFFDDVDFSDKSRSKIYMDEIKNDSYYSEDDGPDIINHKMKLDKDSNRAILNVIMDAREQEDGVILPQHSIERENPTPQKFNGVFFMSEMNSPQKYPKPDITAALEAKRVTKNLDRMESYGLDSMVDIVLTSADKPRNHLFSINKKQSTTKSQQFKIRTGHYSAGLYSGHVNGNLMRTSKHQKQTSIQNSSCAKLTDLPSGLY